MKYILGIDTGGTNTDSVILEKETLAIIAHSKAFTTHDDLRVGIEASLDALDFKDFADICQVSLSTTLATNSIVEKRGCNVALLLSGYDEDIDLPKCDCIKIGGRLDIRGRERLSLSEENIRMKIRNLPEYVEAVAISGYASIRNPMHEIHIQKIVSEETGLPCFCAHELSGTLGFRERTVTAVLNASLICIVSDFIASAKDALQRKGIHAPLMIVRSDGSLMSEEVAKTRPIDTILSGPAASILGAKHLTKIDNAFVLDMGGTTTDIADISNSLITIDDDGSEVGTWKPRCRAVRVSTHGIGGDSRLRFDYDDTKLNITIGPEKVTPICVAAHDSAHIRRKALSLTAADAMDSLGPDVALTPTDFLHASGEYTEWDAEASTHVIKITAERFHIKTNRLIQEVKNSMTKKLTFACLQSTANFRKDPVNLLDDEAAVYLMEKAFVKKRKEFLCADFHLRKPVIAVGAPVKAWLPDACQKMHTMLMIPPNADVANAIGAAIAPVREIARALVRPSVQGDMFTVFLPEERAELKTYDEAADYAKTKLEISVRQRMGLHGKSDCTVNIEEKTINAEIFSSGNKYWIETRFYAEAILNS